MHDPFASFPVSCNWACHIARGSAGGTDYGVSVGTPVRAAFDGVLTNRPPVQFPASGNVAILTRADGISFYHLHLSRFVTPGQVKEGDVIGYSGGAEGAPGSGSSTGPHLHVNAFDQKHQVRDIHDYFTSTAGNSGTLIDPLIPQENDYDWSTAMSYGYRLMGMDNLIPKTATNPTGQQLALAEMDPDPLNVAAGHRNVWVEGSLDSRREWVEYFGPVHMITRLDSWNSRSNDPHRISTFPADAGVTLTDAQIKAIGAGITAGASKADVAAAVKVGSDAVLAKIPTKLTV